VRFLPYFRSLQESKEMTRVRDPIWILAVVGFCACLLTLIAILGWKLQSNLVKYRGKGSAPAHVIYCVREVIPLHLPWRSCPPLIAPKSCKWIEPELHEHLNASQICRWSLATLTSLWHVCLHHVLCMEPLACFRASCFLGWQSVTALHTGRTCLLLG
jgi:hypothetical protein